MVVITTNNQLRRMHQELGDITGDCNVAGRLPDALLNRLQAIQGMLMEEMSNLVRDLAKPIDCGLSRDCSLPTSYWQVFVVT